MPFRLRRILRQLLARPHVNAFDDPALARGAGSALTEAAARYGCRRVALVRSSRLNGLRVRKLSR